MNPNHHSVCVNSPGQRGNIQDFVQRRHLVEKQPIRAELAGGSLVSRDVEFRKFLAAS